MLGDKEIRLAIEQQLIKPKSHMRLIHELGIHRHKVHADVATLTRDQIIGYEIKSDKDSLVRLENQVKYYSKLFDACYLICTEKYVDKALPLLRPWWGMYAVSEVDDGEIVFRLVRPAGQNPKPQNWAIARLWWREELIMTLKERELYRGLSKANKAQLRKVLLEHLSREELLHELYEHILRRQTWRV